MPRHLSRSRAESSPPYSDDPLPCSALDGVEFVDEGHEVVERSSKVSGGQVVVNASDRDAGFGGYCTHGRCFVEVLAERPQG